MYCSGSISGTLGSETGMFFFAYMNPALSSLDVPEWVVIVMDVVAVYV